MKLKHLFGNHNLLKSEETGEVKFEYQSPFDLWITKYTQYRCFDCNRNYWMPKFSFEEAKLREITYVMTLEAVKKLEAQGRYDEAIEILKTLPTTN